jgi:hypothetical protein
LQPQSAMTTPRDKPAGNPPAPPDGDYHRDEDEAPETPPTEPDPVPVQDPPDAPGRDTPYVVR